MKYQLYDHVDSLGEGTNILVDSVDEAILVAKKIIQKEIGVVEYLDPVIYTVGDITHVRIRYSVDGVPFLDPWSIQPVTTFEEFMRS